MSSYCYVAVDPQGAVTRGKLDASDQSEVVRRIKEMGLYPTKVLSAGEARFRPTLGKRGRVAGASRALSMTILGSGIRAGTLTAFTRQTATLVDAGMPLLRGLRTLEQQEGDRAFKGIIGDLATEIENGSTFADALALHPRVFNRLYVNMVKAGEISGSLETTMLRLAEFMEKSRKIRSKVKSALYYPCAVLFIAAIVLGLLMVYVVPRFKEVFEGLLNGVPMPAITVWLLRASDWAKANALLTLIGVVALVSIFLFIAQLRWGRGILDRLKLIAPLLGPVFRKAAISRFCRTLGTLVNSGVPILQALTIVKETAGNLVVGNVISQVHERVKQGDTIAATLKESAVFPMMVAGMVEIGEQTGALPQLLLKISDNYDDEVDDAVAAMTSLLEPVMLLVLAVVVGTIVVALFMPLVRFMLQFDTDQTGGAR